MADSNITKKVLAEAMKKLMQEKDFSKISISDICNLCGVNRKTFYYHFKDKYELVNWIFDIEFISVAKNSDFKNSWESFYSLYRYFEENREFYRRALSVSDYNSFREHFHELLSISFAKKMDRILVNEDIPEKKRNFCAHILSDGIISATERWLTGKENLTADEFCEYLQFIYNKIGSTYDTASFRE